MQFNPYKHTPLSDCSSPFGNKFWNDRHEKYIVMQKQLTGGSRALCTYVHNSKLNYDLCCPNDSLRAASDMHHRHDYPQTALKLLNISDQWMWFWLLTSMSKFNHDTEVPQTMQVFCLKGTEEFLGFIQNKPKKKKSAFYQDIAIHHLECTLKTQVQLCLSLKCEISILNS